MTTTDSGEQDFSITAVIVTYNPDLEILAKILQVLDAQVDSVFVVDNCSSNQPQLEKICCDIGFCPLSANLGLGKAHNLGIETARKQGASHVLLLDQDSLPDPNMVDHMQDIAKSLEAGQVRYSGIGSRYRIGKNGEFSEFVKISWFRFSRIDDSNQSVECADFLISSGTLIPLTAIDEIGLMDETLFIDHIDTEWFLRARHMGYQAYGSNQAFMNHTLGERTIRIWFGRWRQVPFHQPFRYYYIFRNSILLYRRSYMPFKWMLADWVRLAQIFVFFGVLAPQRFLIQKMLWKGVLDGTRGVSGRIRNVD